MDAVYEQKSLRQRIIEEFFNREQFTLTEAYEEFPDKPEHSVRARINESVGETIERLSRSTYKIIKNDVTCLLYQGNGRKPSELGIEPNSIDLIVNDFPWSDKKSNSGGNRNFAQYDCFEYTLDDFKEKYNVLKKGHFLVEILPEENENNFETLYKIKQLAIKAGFSYYSSVRWKKGKFVANTGRKAKNSEMIYIFVKGPKARALRPDVKKDLAEPNKKHYMSGSAKMLPTEFNHEIVARNDKIHTSEKPVSLYSELIELLSKPNETVLDQYAGSGVCGEAALKTNRNCILIELCEEFCEKIINRLGLVPTTC